MLNAQEMEKLAEQTRKRLLRIWDGNARQADKHLCLIMRHYKDVAPSYSINECDMQRVLDMLATLIQR